jgi:hypothetical protein
MLNFYGSLEKFFQNYGMFCWKTSLFLLLDLEKKVLTEIIAGINGDDNARAYKELPGVIYKEDGVLKRILKILLLSSARISQNLN